MSENANKDVIKNPIEALLDENDSSPISLFNEKGEEVKFDQIAVIPLNSEVYAILKPINPMEGVGADEALVFKIVEGDMDDDNLAEGYLNLVADIDIIDKVFEVYNELMDEEDAKQN